MYRVNSSPSKFSWNLGRGRRRRWHLWLLIPASSEIVYRPVDHPCVQFLLCWYFPTHESQHLPLLAVKQVKQPKALIWDLCVYSRLYLNMGRWKDFITLKCNLKLSLMHLKLKNLCSWLLKCCSAFLLFPFSPLLRANFFSIFLCKIIQLFLCPASSFQMLYLVYLNDPSVCFLCIHFFLNKYLSSTYYVPLLS